MTAKQLAVCSRGKTGVKPWMAKRRDVHRNGSGAPKMHGLKSLKLALWGFSLFYFSSVER